MRSGNFDVVLEANGPRRRWRPGCFSLRVIFRGLGRPTTASVKVYVRNSRELAVRDRKFADSPLEGNGFELVVPRRKALDFRGIHRGRVGDLVRHVGMRRRHGLAWLEFLRHLGGPMGLPKAKRSPVKPRACVRTDAILLSLNANERQSRGGNAMSVTAFLEARDFLLSSREDYDQAYRDFRWPELDRFNWALDYFDPLAQGNERPALWLVEEGGAETRLSFASLAEGSNRVANHVRALGVQRGDRVLLMLGNVAPLWECMLAAMKLGAVIIPATTLLTRDDLLDRVWRGRVRHVVAGADNTAKFADLDGGYTRIGVGGAVRGWASWEAGYEAPAEF